MLSNVNTSNVRAMKEIPVILEIVENLEDYHIQKLIGGNRDLPIVFSRTK